MSHKHSNKIKNEILKGERALFNKSGLVITDCIFTDGESPLKECHDIDVINSMFKWKYPLWYTDYANITNSSFFEGARAGVWYSNYIWVENCAIDAPKNFRRCTNLKLIDVSIPNASETLWHCDTVEIKNAVVNGDYFAMNSKNITVDNLTLYGNYSFDGVENVTVKNSKLLTKDAFWNSKNVTVCDSFVSGEYIGWNAENLTFVNCTIESLQGLCYIKNLKMENCKLLNTTLAFEYSSVEADIKGNIESVLNPSSGTITADSIGELIIENDKVDPTKTKITIRNEKQ